MPEPLRGRAIWHYSKKHSAWHNCKRDHMSINWRCRGARVPRDETGSWQVTEGVNHGDHQRDSDDAGVYDVQLGAEINSEPKRWSVQQEHVMTNMLLWRKPYHATKSFWVWKTLLLYREWDKCSDTLNRYVSQKQAQYMFYISCPASSSSLPV